MTSSMEQVAAALRDRYRIIREAGAGGMATVYLAEDLKHHRKVAVKVLRPELAAAMGVDRFRREIEIVAALHHPHILPLFDSGEAAGLLYYVMPFEDGATLRQRIETDRPMPLATVVRILREVAGALAHAHADGVVHRDIKPENVLLSGEHALVTDFGIAKAATGRDAAASMTLTMAGTSLGTPAYMAPEQVAGDAATGPRADIYALGILGYELIAGEPPFRGSAQHILAAHLTETPAPLASRRAVVPPALEALIMRCLEKDPDKRWQSATDLVSALESPAVLGTEGHGTKLRKRRWPLALAAILLVAGVLGIGWFREQGRFGTLIGKDVLAANDLVMVAEFANRTPDTTLAATVTDAVRIELQQSPVVKVLSQREMWQGMQRMELPPGAALPDSQVRELAERLAVKAFVLGDVAPLGGGYQLTARVIATVDGAEGLQVRTTAASEAGLIDAVGELGRKLRRGIGESLQSVAAAPTLAAVTTTSLPALKAYTAGRRAEDEGDRARSNALYSEATSLDSTFEAAWSGLAVNYANAGAYTPALKAITQAYRWRDKLPESQQLSVALNYHNFRGEFAEAAAAALRRTEVYNEGWTSYADLLLGAGRLAEAERAAARGVEESPRTPVAYWNLVEAQVAQERFAAADSTLALLNRRMPGNAWRTSMIGNTLTARHEWDSLETFISSKPGASDPQAPEWKCGLHLARGELAAWDRCSAVPDTTSGGQDPHLVLARLRLTGDTARARRDLDQISLQVAQRPDNFSQPSLIAAYASLGSLAAARRALERWRSTIGANDPRYRMNSPYALAAIAMAEGKFDSAATLFLAWNRSGSLDASHWYNRGLVEAGMALDRAGESDSALALYQKALSMPSISGGGYYELAWYPETLRRLGELEEARGKRQKALGYYERLLHDWRHADPALKPQVEALRERVASLVGEGASSR